MTRAKKVCVALVLMFVSTGTFAQDAKFMSAFLYQFGRIMDFPDKDENFVIGIYGESEVTSFLEKIAEIKKLNDRPIVVREISNAAEAKNCQIVFIPQANSGSLSALKSAVNGNATLLVTEKSDLIRKGAGISFIKVGEKVLFELNKANISASGLRSPLSLERIAHKVY